MDDDEPQEFNQFEATLRYKSEKIPLNLISTNTVGELRELVMELLDDITDAADLRLIVGGRVLSDNEATMESIGIKEGTIVNAAKAAKAAPAPVVQPEALANQMAKPRSPLGMPEGASAALKSPMMQSMLNNPEFMRMMLQSDPRIQEAMERQPELRQMLNDPAFLRQSMEIASNPAALAEMQRNQDRALLNIENLPGGFNALSAMHNNLDSLHGPRPEDPSTDEVNRRFAARLGVSAEGEGAGGTPNSRALPNPWAANQGGAGAQRGAAAGGMGGLGGGFPGLGGSGPSPAMLQQLMNMRGLGGSMPGAEGGSTPSAATPEPAVNYEERFATQLQTMSEMGFTDTAKCLRALMMAGGNVDAAIELLLQMP